MNEYEAKQKILRLEIIRRAERLSSLKSSLYILNPTICQENSNSNDINFSDNLNSIDDLIAYAAKGQTLKFNEKILQSIIDDRHLGQATKKHIKTISNLLQFENHKELSIEKCLKLADSRLLAKLYRSASIVYGFAHACYPMQNEWTLYNWLNCIKECHPKIFRQISHKIKNSTL